MTEAVDPREPRLVACIDLLRRTGAHSVEIRYQDDEKPVVWVAVGEWRTNPVPVRNGRQVRHEAAGALNATDAAFRLCELMIDAAQCANCDRPTGVTFDFEPMPLRENVCWWQYDSDHEKFVRGCGGRIG